MRIIALLLAPIIFTSCTSKSSRPAASESNDSLRNGPEISFVFAFHNRIPDSELRAILSSVDPDVVFVEIAPDDVMKRDFVNSPKEMAEGLRWAEAKHKKAFGFDCPMKTKPDDYSAEAERKVSAEFNAYDRKYDWRDGNKQEVAHELAVILIPFTDSSKMSRRQGCMLKNLYLNLPAPGKALVITGAYHSDFFRATFPSAYFPVTKIKRN